MENELKCDFIIAINSYIEEVGIAEECVWSTGEKEELYLEVPYRGHRLCICPCYQDEHGEHMALFFTDRIDDERRLLESINKKLVVKGRFILRWWLVLGYNPSNVIEDVKGIVKIVVEDGK